NETIVLKINRMMVLEVKVIYRRKSEDFHHKAKDGWRHQYRTCKKMANKPPAPYRTGTQKRCRKSNKEDLVDKRGKGHLCFPLCSNYCLWNVYCQLCFYDRYIKS